MSEENVEIARRAWDAWQRGDLESLFELYAPDVGKISRIENFDDRAEALEAAGLTG